MSRTALLALLVLLPACGQGDDGISREKFVRVNVALRQVPDSARNAAARRDSVLRRERVTAAQMERWVKTHAGSASLMVAWREIAAELDSAGKPKPAADKADTAARPAPSAPMRERLRQAREKFEPAADQAHQGGPDERRPLP